MRPEAIEGKEEERSATERSSGCERWGVSQANTAHSCRCAGSTVEEVERRAQAAGIAWPLPEEMDDAAIRARAYPPRERPSARRASVAPDREPLEHHLRVGGTLRERGVRDTLEAGHHRGLRLLAASAARSRLEALRLERPALNRVRPVLRQKSAKLILPTSSEPLRSRATSSGALSTISCRPLHSSPSMVLLPLAYWRMPVYRGRRRIGCFGLTGLWRF